MSKDMPAAGTSLNVVSLFSGIGGVDLGLIKAGHTVLEMCEYWEPARAVLTERFPGIPVEKDVRTYTPSVAYDLLTAGFPCVDLSHAGGQRGIFGPQSGLVEHVFRILDQTRPEWVILENVPNLLRLQKGAGIAHVIDSLSSRGYRWAYRVIDSRSAGVPQRRHRVIILASLSHEPAAYLLADDAGELSASTLESEPVPESKAESWGFYWTEGRRGVGLVRGATPTLKGGSTVGAPSAPAIWNPDAPIGKKISMPTIEDGEVLQGFERGWTSAADGIPGPKSRWKLVGNAVTVGVAEWLGRTLSYADRTWSPPEIRVLDRNKPWPNAAWGSGTDAWKSSASKMPTAFPMTPLSSVINPKTSVPLSYRATAGFLSRVAESGINLDDRFVKDLESHLAKTRKPLGPRTDTAWDATGDVSRRIRNGKSDSPIPELALRRELTDRRLRYRLRHRPEPHLRWRSDIVFIRPRVVVDVRGCFWHACPEHGSIPAANIDRWKAKLAGNADRDQRMVSELSAAGWKVLIVWEHEDPKNAADRIQAALAGDILLAETIGTS